MMTVLCPAEDVFTAIAQQHPTGQGLPELRGKAEMAILRMAPLEQQHNRTHSQWMRRHLTLSWYAPHHNMRQVAAELASRREALANAEHALRTRSAQIALADARLATMRAEADVTPEAQARIALKEARTAQLRSEIANTLKYVDGALRDVLALEALYEQLVTSHGEPSAAAFEAEEQASHLRRAFAQALRDIRNTGRISNGNQEYLEQCGVSPSAALRECSAYLQTELTGGDDIRALAAFLDAMAARFLGCGTVAAECRGLIDAWRTDIIAGENQ